MENAINVTPRHKTTLHAVYDSLQHISLAFPVVVNCYFKWKDSLIDEQEFYDTILTTLNHYAAQKFLDDEGNFAVILSDADHSRIKSWIQSSVTFKKAIMYYKNGLRCPADEAEYTTMIVTKAMTALNDALEDEDPRIRVAIVGITSRSILDSEDIRAQIRQQHSMNETARFLATHNLAPNDPK